MGFILSPDIAPRLRRREEAAFAEVLRIAGPAMISLVKSYGHSQDEAEDIVQAVFLQLWELGDRFRPTISVEAYLLMMARNQALRVHRNAGIRERYVRRYATEVGVRSEGDDIAAPLASLLQRDEAAQILHGLASLTEHQRTAFELRYGQGLTIPEIAAVLSISPKGVERLMTRIKKLLREYILNTKK